MKLSENRKNIYVETYGCSANKNNSEIILSKALCAGYRIVSDPKKADIIVINTCTVKHITEQRIFSRLRELKHIGDRVIVTGCMIPYQREEIRSISKDFILVPWNNLDMFNKLFNVDNPDDSLFSFSPITKIIQIGYGCLGNCAYCATKLVKGNVVSKDVDTILHEIEKALKRGYREIYLTSTDNAAYGYDIGIRLPTLLRKILEEFDGDYIIRVGMMNPVLLQQFYKEYLPLYNDPRMYRFLHLPIQSGSEKVLKDMNRPTSIDHVFIIHDTFMGITNGYGNFSTDIIVGYPTETFKDFTRTIDVVKRLMPDMTHVSKFGPRKGTLAARLKKLPSQIVKERSRSLSKLTREISEKRNKLWVGKKTEVLIKEIKDTYISGRNREYKKVLIKGTFNKSILGKWVPVVITDYTHSHLLAEAL